MLPELAGVLRRHGPVTESDRRALRGLLGPGSRLAEGGPLAVCWTGEGDVAGDRLALLGGRRSAGPAPRAGTLEVPPALRGEFALLLWDGRRGLIARDHLGHQGLYFHDDGGRLAFATEIVRLLALLPRRPGPRRDAVPLWLGTYGFPADVTLYEGVRRVGPGSVLELDPRRPRPQRTWWEPALDPIELPADEAAARLRETLQIAVGRRCPPGEQVGVLLSGGLDSSSVAGIASTVEQPPRRAYSAVFPDHPSIDEAPLIARLCADLGLAGTRAVVRSGSVLSGAIPYIEHWAIPPVSPNLFFWGPLLERAAADGCDALIDGEGGDEVFGLSPYLLSDLLARGRISEVLDLVRRVPGADGDPTRRQIRDYVLRYGVGGLPPAWAHALSRSLRGPGSYVPAWIRPAAARDFALHVDGAAWKRGRGRRWQRFLRWATGPGLGPALLYEHSRLRAAMAGLEARHPLTDPDVIELMLRLPPEHAYDPHRTRPLLRAALAGLVPDEVRLRPAKSTFDAIFQDSLLGPDLPLVRAFLGPGARVGEYVDLDVAERRLLNAVPPAGSPERPLWAGWLWRLLTGEAWLRSLEDPSGLRRTATAAGMSEADCRLEADTPSG
jgi:asparagine synthase (glutamine-hydrolysing)